MARRVFLFLLFGACSSAKEPAADSGWDSLPVDARRPGDTAPPVPKVDFTVANCPEFDVQKGTCIGLAPFTVQFMPIASSGITQFVWDFGDGPTQSPWHTFSLPGTYDITLNGGGVGSASLLTQTRRAFITVLPSPAGSACQYDEQCASSTCLCSANKPCSYGPVSGLCANLCQKTSCPDGQVCANLVTTAFTKQSESWHTQVCLSACERDEDCPADLSCRALPAWPNAANKVKGCFVGVPAELGHPCVNADGLTRSDLCLSGLCADMGALGLCSRDCSNDSCPVGSDCAVFGDGRTLCLVPCSSTFTCDADPLLSCVAASNSQLGFQIQSSGNAGAVYCAPKPCVANSDCGASGVCRQASGGGHCVSRLR